MRRIRRGIEYVVHSADGVHWTWVAQLRAASGEPLNGTVNGSEAVAVKLCMAAIDEALAEGTDVKLAPEAAIAAAPARAARLREPRLGDATREVLVAEDESMFRAAAVESLTACGFKVFQAGDGEEALAILKQHPAISLLVTDVRMPNMDGYELVEAGLAMRPNLKVILMTGYSQPAPRVIAAHEIGTLRKPFDVDVLCRRAEDLVRLH